MNCNAGIVDAVQLSQLDHGAVASVYGGGIPAQQRVDGRLVPLQPTFRVRLEGCDFTATPNAKRQTPKSLAWPCCMARDAPWQWKA